MIISRLGRIGLTALISFVLVGCLFQTSAQDSRSGQWIIDTTRGSSQYQLTLNYSSTKRGFGNNISSFSVSPDRLPGLTSAQIMSSGSPVRFQLVRDAGAIAVGDRHRRDVRRAPRELDAGTDRAHPVAASRHAKGRLGQRAGPRLHEERCDRSKKGDRRRGAKTSEPPAPRTFGPANRRAPHPSGPRRQPTRRRGTDGPR